MSLPEPFIPSDKKHEPQSWSILIPKEPRQYEQSVPESFFIPIFLHIVKNELTEVLRPPLILAIQGPAGEGKSFQTREACSQLGVYLIPISGASLSGQYEKEAVEVLERAYLYASAVRESSQNRTALLIDDFDLSVASTFDDRRYTVNTQLLTGFLMNLADDPTRCSTKHTFRIPIIMTGNNFAALHAPLVRDGRVNFFNWRPSIDQKVEIIRSIFSSMLLKEELGKVKKLLEAYPDKPISFFAALKDDIIDEIILDTRRKENGKIVMSSIRDTVIDNLQHQTLDIKKLLHLAEKRSFAGVNDYLELDNDELQNIPSNMEISEPATQKSGTRGGLRQFLGNTLSLRKE